MGNLEFDNKIFQSNINAIAKFTDKRVISVLKANAYGFDLSQVAKICEEIDAIDLIAIANITEALEIKNVKKEKLIFGTCENLALAAKNKFHITIPSYEWFKENYSYIKEKQIPVHVAINLGMNRNGLEFDEFNLADFNEINLVGIYGHLQFVENTKYTKSQVLMFDEFVNSIDFEFKYIHLQNSGGCLDYISKLSTHVRPGIIQYGVSPYEIDQKLTKQCFKVISKIEIIRNIFPGETVGYGDSFIAKEKCRVALVPFGYADGYTKNLLHSKVTINNKHYEVVAIAMDYIFVLVDNLVTTSDKIELFNNVTELANLAKTVPHEILVNIDKKRLKRNFEW